MTLQQNNVKIQINLPTKFKYFQLIRKAKKGILSKEWRRISSAAAILPNRNQIVFHLEHFNLSSL